jgi:hypothetical protein
VHCKYIYSREERNNAIKKSEAASVTQTQIKKKMLLRLAFFSFIFASFS